MPSAVWTEAESTLSPLRLTAPATAPSTVGPLGTTATSWRAWTSSISVPARMASVISGVGNDPPPASTVPQRR